MTATLRDVEVPMTPYQNGASANNPRAVLLSVRKEGKRIIGPRLRALRVARNIDMRDMARALELNPSTIQRWETKTEIASNHPVIPKLAEFFGVSPVELAGDSEAPPLTDTALHVIGYRMGKKFPNQRPRQPRGEKSSRNFSAHPGAIASRKWREEHGAKGRRVPAADPTLSAVDLPIEEVRVMVTTFNAQRMRGEKMVTMPIDVVQNLIASQLRNLGYNPLEILVTRDFADIFHKTTRK